MNSIIDHPLLIINDKIKSTKWVSLKSLLLLFGLSVISGIMSAHNEGQSLFMVLSLCLFLIITFVMGLMMVKFRYRESNGETPNFLIPLMQFTWFSSIDQVLRKFLNILLTLYIYIWFGFIGFSILFYLYSGLAS